MPDSSNSISGFTTLRPDGGITTMTVDVMDDDTHGAGALQNTVPGLVEAIQMGPGWVYFGARHARSPVPDLPLFLNQTLVGWLKEHPHYRIRATQGIVVRGQTVGLHVWYEPLEPPPS